MSARTLKPILLNLLTALCLISMAGCASRIPLTPAVIREYKLSNDDIKKLQLYLSDGLLLEQENSSVDKDVDSTHSLKTVVDNYVKQIFFKKKTPCIAVDVKADKVAVAFEPGEQVNFELKSSHYTFVADRRGKEAKELKRLPESGFKDWNCIGVEQYRDTTYNVLVKKEAPYLLADQKGLKKLVVENVRSPACGSPGNKPPYKRKSGSNRLR